MVKYKDLFLTPMELSLTEQAKNLIEKSSNILLVAHAKMDGDTLSATIAMHLLLQKLNKKTTVACADAVPEVYSFLPETNIMTREIDGGNNFVISLDCSEKKVKKLHWKMEGDQLKIILSPEQLPFVAENVSFGEQSSFDLIISLDAADREQLGSIFEENTELFSSVPVLVFDHHASNPGFGNINIIDTKAASTTEVLFHFLPILLGEEWKKMIDPDIATLLLTGIITDTGSFQNPNTTPRSLEVAADLADLGARQQEIIRNIFKTKNIETLKLWGRVLSKIKSDPIHRLLWSTVSKDDLLDTGAKTEDLDGIVDELLATAPGMEIVLLIKEREDGVISTSVRTTTPLCDAAEFAGHFGGGGHTQAGGFKIRGSKPFEVVVGEVISEAQNFQKERLQIITPEEELAKEEENISKESSSEETTSVDILGTIQGKKEEKNNNDSPLEVIPEMPLEKKETPLISPEVLSKESISPEVSPEEGMEKESPLISPEDIEGISAPLSEEISNPISRISLEKEEEETENIPFETEEKISPPPDILENTPQQQNNIPAIPSTKEEPLHIPNILKNTSEQENHTPQITPEKKEEVSEIAPSVSSSDILSTQEETSPEISPAENIAPPIMPKKIEEKVASEQAEVPVKTETVNPLPQEEITPEIIPQKEEEVPAPKNISPEEKVTIPKETLPSEPEKKTEEVDISHEEFSNMLEKMMKTNPADHVKKG